MKKDILKSVKGAFNKSLIKAKKYSPEILVVSGVVGIITSTVIACKATTKMSSILENAKDDIEAIHKCANDDEMADTYTKEDEKKDLAIVYIQTGMKIAKLYTPSVILGALSITSIVASHDILRKRNAALVAAYATVDKTYKEYRNRVVERFGEGVDKELLYNIKAKKFEETVKDPESGKEKRVKSTVGIANPEVTDYTMWFDESCECYDSNMDYNLMFLRSQQTFANDKFRADGYLFLSDIYEAFGKKRTKMSQTVGWVYDPNNSDGDNFVDFGMVETYRETEDGRYEKAILLNFNVDGPILDRI